MRWGTAEKQYTHTHTHTCEAAAASLRISSESLAADYTVTQHDLSQEKQNFLEPILSLVFFDVYILVHFGCSSVEKQTNT